MNHIETIIKKAAELKKVSSDLNDKMNEALGYIVLISHHEAWSSSTTTDYFSIWKAGTDYSCMSVRYVTCKNGDYWDECAPNKFSHEDLDIMEEVLNGTV